ncbi:Transcriptional regulatory protein, C terminal [Maricaulis salignorans]|uniref:Transcriptional regulatory protein, C terminal n=1 Tax=Maricaulis salignorans TaxID=144026 RepID=A0A1G9PTB0_9PROT|nr:Transcriptional regulatory protein, C terminal [Maricaulis salignorans]
MSIPSARPSHPSPALTTVQIGAAVCDLRSGVLEIDGRSHRLEPRLAGVLDLLVRRAGAPVTRDEFLETVWDEDGSDEALNQAISRLRRLLGRADLIVTLPRIGYRLALDPAPGVLAGLPAGERSSASLGALLSGLDRNSFIAGFVAAVLCCAVLYALFGTRIVEREFEIRSDAAPLADEIDDLPALPD